MSVGLATLSGAGPASPQSAPVSVVFGDGTVNGARLKPYDNAFVLTLKRADGQILSPGIWTDQLRLRDVNGRKAWVRTQSLGYYDGRVLTSVNTFDPVTFAPISTFLNNNDGTHEQWTYTPTDAEGHIFSADGKETVQHIPLKNRAYDFNCCMRSLIPAALPLGLGKAFTLPGIVEGDESITERVVGRERIKAGYLGMIDTWKVETPGPGGGFIRFWIANKPPFLVRMTLTDIPASKTKDGIHYDQFYDIIDQR